MPLVGWRHMFDSATLDWSSLLSALVISCGISLWKGAKALDSDLCKKVKEQSLDIARKDAELACKHPADQHKESEVTAFLGDLSDKERKIVQWVSDHSPTTHARLLTGLGWATHEDIRVTYAKASDRGYIQPDPIDTHLGVIGFRIHDAYKEAFKSVLHPTA